MEKPSPRPCHGAETSRPSDNEIISSRIKAVPTEASKADQNAALDAMAELILDLTENRRLPHSE